MKKENPYLVAFAKSYPYEGKEYGSLDLSRMEGLTAEQLFEASRVFSTEDYITPRPEADPKFCCMIAAAACGIPHEFFGTLPMREVIKVRDAVQAFFQGEV